MKIRLYHYWRSSSSWRVRWGLAIKGMLESEECIPVSLLDGESESETHRARNPLGFVPVIEVIEPQNAPVKYLGESLAILQWLEELKPTPSFFPQAPLLRARTRQLAEIVNAGTQPVQNLTVALHLAPGSEPEAVKAREEWMAHWIRHGLRAYETLARETAGRYSVGDEITLADLCLIPQCYNALRQNIPLEEFPLLKRIYEAARATPACKQAEPEAFAPKTP